MRTLREVALFRGREFLRSVSMKNADGKHQKFVAGVTSEMDEQPSGPRTDIPIRPRSNLGSGHGTHLLLRHCCQVCDTVLCVDSCAR
jgi:hypothetical protein